VTKSSIFPLLPSRLEYRIGITEDATALPTIRFKLFCQKLGMYNFSIGKERHHFHYLHQYERYTCSRCWTQTTTSIELSTQTASEGEGAVCVEPRTRAQIRPLSNVHIRIPGIELDVTIAFTSINSTQTSSSRPASTVEWVHKSRRLDGYHSQLNPDIHIFNGKLWMIHALCMPISSYCINSFSETKFASTTYSCSVQLISSASVPLSGIDVSDGASDEKLFGIISRDNLR